MLDAIGVSDEDAIGVWGEMQTEGEAYVLSREEQEEKAR